MIPSALDLMTLYDAFASRLSNQQFVLAIPSAFSTSESNEPEQAIQAFTVPSRSGQNNTISTDSNEPMRGICIFTVPPTIGPHDTIGSLLPWIKWAHTIISSYDDASDPEPERTIRVHTVLLRRDHCDVIGPGSDDPIRCIRILTVQPTIRPRDTISI